MFQIAVEKALKKSYHDNMVSTEFFEGITTSFPFGQLNFCAINETITPQSTWKITLTLSLNNIGDNNVFLINVISIYAASKV